MANRRRGRNLLQILNSVTVDWDAFLDRHSRHPDEGADLARRESVRRLLSRRPPARVVLAMIDAHADVLFPSRAAGRSGSGGGGGRSTAECTLLHEACLSEQSPDVVRLILDGDGSAASTEYEVTRSVPLHFAESEAVARILLDACPRTVGAKDRWGNLPLHSAVIHGRSVGLVRLLLAEGSRHDVGGALGGGGSLVRAKVGRGHTPFDLAAAAAARALDSCDCVDASISDDGRDDDFRRAWDVLTVLAREASKMLARRGGYRHEFSMLHAVIELGCPPNIIKHAMTLNKSQLRRRDGLGRTPLIVAATTEGAKSQVFDALLDPDNGFPGAARMADRDGHLPLHLAAGGGGRDFRDGGIEAILRAEPLALCARDAKSRFFPFMGPGCTIDTIFGLLREGPSVLQLACNRNVSVDGPKTMTKGRKRKRKDIP